VSFSGNSGLSELLYLHVLATAADAPTISRNSPTRIEHTSLFSLSPLPYQPLSPAFHHTANNRQLRSELIPDDKKNTIIELDFFGVDAYFHQ